MTNRFIDECKDVRFLVSNECTNSVSNKCKDETLFVIIIIDYCVRPVQDTSIRKYIFAHLYHAYITLETYMYIYIYIHIYIYKRCICIRTSDVTHSSETLFVETYIRDIREIYVYIRKKCTYVYIQY